jgi:hypothetical protein
MPGRHIWIGTREQFSDLQKDAVCCQLGSANIPVNRELFRELGAVSGPDRVYSLINSGVDGF